MRFPSLPLLENSACAAFFLAAAISGPLRWMLASTGLAPLAYAPILLGALIAFVTAWRSFSNGPFGSTALGALLIWIFSICIGIIYVPSVKQVIFAAYMFIPLYMGLILGPAWMRITNNKKVISGLWTAVTFGVILNPYLTYPWVGFEYSVGGVSVETSREWWSGDVQRYAGLARASFDAAVQIVILASILVTLTPSRLLRLVIYATSGYGIWLTNSKTVVIVLVIVVLAAEISNALLDHTRVLIVGMLAFFGFAMPLIGWLYEPRLNAVNTSAGLASYEDRLRYMWPEAFDLWLHGGNVFTGRGLGSIGTAQTYFEPQRFNAGDNLFLYLFVTLGIIALPLILYVCAKFAMLKTSQTPAHKRIFLLGLIPLSYGLTANVVENASLAIVVGLMCRMSCDQTSWQQS
jgi:hypothetical protein